MKYKTILFDFNGVLSHDQFWRPLENSHPDVYKFIQTNIFGSIAGDLANRWMRAEVNVDDIHKMIIEGTGIDKNILQNALVVGAKQFALDTKLIDQALQLKSFETRVGIVTGNMDVFDKYVAPSHKLEQKFDFVINSFTHKCLKREGLFDIVKSKLKLDDFSSTLLIEDSIATTSFFESIGGNSYYYTNYDDFICWKKNNL